jgi:hypothetical protein
MANYPKKVMVGGKWAKSGDIKSGTRAKIVSETEPQTSTFVNKDGSPKTQDVCKIVFEGSPEVFNVSLNRATINGLSDAFGEDSKGWMNHYLTVETEKMRVAGKAVVALYLIPKGYERVDDENGYAVIVKEGTSPVDAPEEELPEIPF